MEYADRETLGIHQDIFQRNSALPNNLKKELAGSVMRICFSFINTLYILISGDFFRNVSISDLVRAFRRKYPIFSFRSSRRVIRNGLNQLIDFNHLKLLYFNAKTTAVNESGANFDRLTMAIVVSLARYN
jgi:hypothetical protein